MRLILSVLLLMASISVVALEPQPQIKADHPKKSPEVEKRGSDKNSLTMNVVPSQYADEKVANGESYRQEKHLQDWLLVGSTVFLAIVTLALAVFTACLWWATRQLVIDAKNTSRAQLRAYMAMTGGSVTIHQSNPAFLRIYVQYQNFGSTPSPKVRTWITHKISKDKPEEMRHDKKIGEFKNRGERAPKVDLDLMIDVAITPEELQGLRDCALKVWAWGCVEYTDIFGEKHQIPIRTSSQKVNGLTGWALGAEDDEGQHV